MAATIGVVSSIGHSPIAHCNYDEVWGYDGDAVVFMNFRADRARQLTGSFVDPGFQGFERARIPKLSAFVCLSEYDAELPVPVAFPPESLENTLADVLAAQVRDCEGARAVPDNAGAGFQANQL